MEHLKIPSRWKMRASPGGEGGREKIYYNLCEMGPKEELRCLFEGLLIIGIFAYFFYRSVFAFFVLTPGIYWYRRWKQRSFRKGRKEALEKQFREMILSVNVNLQTGYSVENAFLESYRDVVSQFGAESDMARELWHMKKGLSNQVPLEALLLDLGNRCGEGDIKEFTQVFSIARHTGGKWNEVMQKTVDVIQKKIEIKEEIEILVHAKKLESRIMFVIPFFILFYMNFTSKGYFNVLYHNLPGVGIMTGCLLFYGLAVYLGERITEIEIA